MSFVVYLAVLLVAAASAMFGLDLLTSPLPPKPPSQLASTTKGAPQKLSQRQAAKEQADKEANNRALSPVFPAHPGESSDVKAANPRPNETTGTDQEDTAARRPPAQAEPKNADTAAVEDKPPAQDAVATPRQPQKPASAQAQAPESPQMAAATPDDRSESQHGAPAIAEPAARQAVGRCDVQACTEAYSSFRASDCTYQPFSGPRRLCARGSASRRTVTSYRPRAAEARPQRDTRDWDSRRNPELDDAVRRVQQMPDDDGYDQPRSRRRVIVIERGGGLWP